MATDYTEEQLEAALRRAHAAGDRQAAQMLADALAEKRQSGGFFQGVAEAFRGDAAEDLPNAPQVLDWREEMQTAMPSMFGSDEDYAAALQEMGAEIGQDANGNLTFTMPDGRKGYVNQPGFDLEDVTRFAGKAASFTPAGKFASAGKSLLSKIGRGALGAGATDVAMQKAAGREDVDLGQTGTVAAFGAGAEFGAGALSKIGQWAKQTFGDVRQQALEAGRELARRHGIDQLADDELMELGQKALMAADDVDPRLLAEEAEFGFQHSRGALTGSHPQLRREEMLRQGDQGAGLRNMDVANREQIGEAAQGLVNRMGGGGATHPTDAAQNVYEGVRGAAQRLDDQVSEAYGGVGQAFVGREATEDLPTRLMKALQESGTITNPSVTPKAMAAIQDVTESLAKMPESVSAVSVKAIENQRRRLNSLFSRNMDDADRRALAIVKGELDNWMDEAVDTALYSGDEGALEALKQARALRAKYGRLFQGRDEPGKVVQKILSEARSPEEVGNFIVGVSGFSKANAARIVDRLKEAAPEVLPDLREHVLLKIMTKSGSPKTAGTLRNSLREAIGGKGRSLMQTLYSPAELQALSRFTQALDSIRPKGDFAKSSGTAERLLRYANQFFGGLPILSSFRNVAHMVGGQRALQMPRASVPVSPYALPAGEVPQILQQ